MPTRNFSRKFNLTKAQVYPYERGMDYKATHVKWMPHKCLAVTIGYKKEKSVVKIEEFPQCDCSWRCSNLNEVCRHIVDAYEEWIWEFVSRNMEIRPNIKSHFPGDEMLVMSSYVSLHGGSRVY